MDRPGVRQVPEGNREQRKIIIMIITKQIYLTPKLFRCMTALGTYNIKSALGAYNIKSFTYEINRHMQVHTHTLTHTPQTHMHAHACMHAHTHKHIVQNLY